jgi:hypothetical protein
MRNQEHSPKKKRRCRDCKTRISRQEFRRNSGHCYGCAHPPLPGGERPYRAPRYARKRASIPESDPGFENVVRVIEDWPGSPLLG